MKTTLSSKLEALLFVAGDDGLTMKQLQFLSEAEKVDILSSVEELTQRYKQPASGIMLKELAGVYQLVTKPEAAET